MSPPKELRTGPDLGFMRQPAYRLTGIEAGPKGINAKQKSYLYVCWAGCGSKLRDGRHTTAMYQSGGTRFMGRFAAESLVRRKRRRYPGVFRPAFFTPPPPSLSRTAPPRTPRPLFVGYAEYLLRFSRIPSFIYSGLLHISSIVGDACVRRDDNLILDCNGNGPNESRIAGANHTAANVSTAQDGTINDRPIIQSGDGRVRVSICLLQRLLYDAKVNCSVSDASSDWP
ncbi:unnamed protein product, partial [Iphiclides podalirius]